MNDQQMAIEQNTAGAASLAIQEAWARFHATVDAMRDELYRATAYRYSSPGQVNHYLMQLQAFAYHLVLSPRQRHPVIQGGSFFQAHGFRIGLQSPHFLYRAVFLDGSQTYRLHGQRGNTLFHQILVLRGGYNDPSPTEVGECLLDDFVREDGRFDITVGGPAQPDNWIALDPDSRNNWIFMRECCHDWAAGDCVDDMDIEPVGDFVAAADAVDEAEFIRRLAGAERLIKVLHLTASWPHFEKNNFEKTGPNRFSPLVHPKAAAYNPVATYLWSQFELGADEALVIECPLPEQFRYWDICTCDIWGQNNDFIYHQASLTNFQALPDADGRVRIVVSQRDPGVPNWLDTVGLLSGSLMWRWYWASEQVQPLVQRVKLADLRQHLPAQTAHVTPEARQAELRLRRRSVLRRYRNLV